MIKRKNKLNINYSKFSGAYSEENGAREVSKGYVYGLRVNLLHFKWIINLSSPGEPFFIMTLKFWLKYLRTLVHTI